MSFTKLRGLTVEIYKELYEHQHLRQRDIAKRFGVHQSAIQWWATKRGLKGRTQDHPVRYEQARLRFTGPNNPGWNGGRTHDHGGYVLIRDPQHPRADNRGYVKEHIKVWMETHGREVPRKWQVHHINGNKKDNRPSNLVALPDTKHRRVIPLLQRRIRQLERELSRLQSFVKELNGA